MPLHDWSDDRAWDSVHQLWIVHLLFWLRPRLPAGYRAYLGSVPGRAVAAEPGRPVLGVRSWQSDPTRRRAVHARELGYAVVDIAAIRGLREETVSRWWVQYAQGGEEALPGDRTGRPLGSGRLLSPVQEQAMQDLIHAKTPQTWTSRRPCGPARPFRS